MLQINKEKRGWVKGLEGGGMHPIRLLIDQLNYSVSKLRYNESSTEAIRL